MRKGLTTFTTIGEVTSLIRHVNRFLACLAAPPGQPAARRTVHVTANLGVSKSLMAIAARQCNLDVRGATSMKQKEKIRMKEVNIIVIK